MLTNLEPPALTSISTSEIRELIADFEKVLNRIPSGKAYDERQDYYNRRIEEAVDKLRDKIAEWLEPRPNLDDEARRTCGAIIRRCDQVRLELEEYDIRLDELRFLVEAVRRYRHDNWPGHAARRLELQELVADAMLVTSKYPMMIYLTQTPAAIPEGQVLVHNEAFRPTRGRLGSYGALAWLQPPDDKLEPCDCGWASELATHYRVILKARS